MKKLIVICDVCGTIMTDINRMEDYFGITLTPYLDGDKTDKRLQLSISNCTKSPYGSSSKGAHLSIQHICSPKCLARALNNTFKEARIKLEVIPILEEVEEEK